MPLPRSNVMRAPFKRQFSRPYRNDARPKSEGVLLGPISTKKRPAMAEVSWFNQNALLGLVGIETQDLQSEERRCACVVPEERREVNGSFRLWPVMWVRGGEAKGFNFAVTSKYGSREVDYLALKSC